MKGNVFLRWQSTFLIHTTDDDLLLVQVSNHLSQEDLEFNTVTEAIFEIKTSKDQ